MTRWISELTKPADWFWVLASIVPLGGVGLALLAVGWRTEQGLSPRSVLRRFAFAVERVFRVEAWAGVLVGCALWGTMVAGLGFRWDLGWHVLHGRDATLVPPHVVTAIGALLITLGAVLAVCIASDRKQVVWRRVGDLHIPASAALTAGLSIGAISGLSIDDLWHRALGKDASVWSPPHLVMLITGGLVPFAMLLALRESGTRPRDSVGAWGAHALTLVAALGAMSPLQAEFNTGGPRALLIQHPILIAVAAGLVLPSARWILGRGGALLVVGILAAFDLLPFVPPWHLHRPREALYLGAAIAVELIGSRPPRSWRRVAVGGALVGVGCYLGEQIWSSGWYQPWPTRLMPVGIAAAAAACGAATVLAACIWRRAGLLDLKPMRRGGLLALALVMFLGAAPLVRLDRRVDVAVDVPRGDSGVVSVRFLDPTIPEKANWFVVAGFGAGFFSSTFERRGDVYVSRKPAPMAGEWRTVVRLQLGASMLLVPLHFPADTGTGVSPLDTRHFAGRMPSEASDEILKLAGLPSTRELVAGYVALALLIFGLARALTSTAAAAGRQAGRTPRLPVVTPGRDRQPGFDMEPLLTRRPSERAPSSPTA